MSDVLITFALQIAALLPFLIVAGLRSKRRDVKFLALAVALMLVDNLLLTYTKKIPGLWLDGLHWNWYGKAASTALSVGFFASPMFRRGSGMTWRQREGSLKPGLMLLGILAIAGLVVGHLEGTPPFNQQTFAFQLLMPSLDEEFFFRGLLFYTFSRALVSDAKGTNWGAAIVVTIWFSIVHALAWKAGEFHFDAFSLLEVTIVGSVFMILRVRSGSLVFSIVGHSLYNLLCT